MFQTTRYILSLVFALCVAMPWAISAHADEQEGVPFNGIVTDIAGQPLRGVRVYTFDRNFFTTTDRKGRFGLTNVLADDTIHIEYHKVHYDIPVEGRKSMVARLGDQFDSYQAQADADLENLGYGFISRRESCSSSSGISGEVLRRTGRYNVLEALQGLVPGLTIAYGADGEYHAIIRGIGTINSSTDPLFIVDGVTVSSLDFVNIEDVESVEVMKEAGIYGSQGANGAILVTTKH